MYQYDNLDERSQTRIKNRYFIGSVTNIAIAVVALLVLVLYSLPNYAAQSATVASANAVLSDITKDQQTGMDVSAIKTALHGNSSFDQNTVDALFRNPTKFSQAVKKPSAFSGDYIAWMNDRLAHIGDATTAVQNKERILWNIIPVLDSEGIQPNRITLGGLVSYIEDNLLHQFHLDSSSSIGFGTVTFESGAFSSVNIGSYQMKLNFSGTNGDIKSMINFIQSSGKLTIQNGVLVSGDANNISTDTSWLSGLSNLLITINSLALSGPIANDWDQNTGSALLTFYVRWASFADLLEFRKQVAQKYDAMDKEIKQYASLCQQGNSCDDPSIFHAVANIQNIGIQLNAFQSQIAEIKKPGKPTDLQKAWTDLTGLFTSLNILSDSLDSFATVLSPVKK